MPGANLVSRLTFRPGTSLSTTSMVVLRLLSVVHFSVRVIPRSFTWYLVSRLPDTLPLSMAELPPVVNSTPVAVFVLTWNRVEEIDICILLLYYTSKSRFIFKYLELEKAKVITFAKDIVGLLSEIAELWWSHLDGIR